MTDREQRLQEIRERHEASSRGDWMSHPSEYPEETYVDSESTEIICENLYDVDAEFIAHAHQDIPYLLAEIERLEKAHEAIDDFATETFIVEEFNGEEYISRGYHQRFIQQLTEILGSLPASQPAGSTGRPPLPGQSQSISTGSNARVTWHEGDV